MNCQKGDLAVIVSGLNQGRFMFVLEASVYGADYWFVKVLGGPLEGTESGKKVFLRKGHIEDNRLRPLRDTPGDDETLRWAPVPGERVTA